MSGMELFGFFGSALVAVSLMMSNLKKLRWINMAGAMVFTLYGYLIGALPVFALNAWIVLVNIWYLVKMYQSREKFSLIPAKQGADDPVVKMFLTAFNDDIDLLFPSFKGLRLDESDIWLVYRDVQLTGIFIFQKNDSDKSLSIELDYVTPAFRDMKNSALVFNQLKQELSSLGYRSAVTLGEHDMHRTYLTNLGFQPVDAENLKYKMDLV